MEITPGMKFVGQDPSGDHFFRIVERVIVTVEDGSLLPSVSVVVQDENGRNKQMSFLQAARAVPDVEL
jgi:hypothetical protein